MKRYKLYISLAALSLLISSGCRTDLASVNEDPNAISESTMDYKYLLTAAEMYAAGTDYEGWRNSMIYCSTMIQHLASNEDYWNGDKYTYSAGYNSAYWDRQFPNGIRDIIEVIAHYKDKSEYVNAYNIARIVKVISFQRMTDLYGDVPYSEAGSGYMTGTLYPKYDKQQEIYADMLNELNEAAQALNVNASNTLGSADLIYKGDVTLWKKYAYSEMLRLAMRMSKVNATDAEKWVKVAVAGGLISSNDENALIQHNTTVNNACNGNARILVWDDPNATRLSKTLVDMLKNTSDPRLKYMATVATNPGAQWSTSNYDYGDTTYSKQIGMPNGYDVLGSTTDISNASNWPGTKGVYTNVDRNKYSIVNRYTFARMDAPTFMHTYAENQLLLAEAAYRGWVTGEPETYYNEGVKAAMEQLTQTGANPGVSSTQVSAYLAKNPYNSATALQQINTQYWLATFMDEYEAWCNWRRSGYPQLTPVNYFGNVTNGTIPRRFTYPTSEATSNTKNYDEAVSRLSNGDVMTSRVWWDVE